MYVQGICHNCNILIVTYQHAIHAERGIVLPILSVCLSVRLSVCLSSAGTVSKQMDMSSHFLDILVWASF